MKKSILVASTFIAGIMFISCSSPAEKKQAAEQEVNEATDKLNAANELYLADVAAFKKETEEKVAANEKSIAEFKARINSDKQIAKAEYEQKIADLEQKNTDIKKRMDDYKVQSQDQWELFKAEFSNDMDALGKAFSAFTVSSK